MPINPVASSINALSDRIMQYGEAAGNRKSRAADLALKGAEIDLANRRYDETAALRGKQEARLQSAYDKGAPKRELEAQTATNELAEMTRLKATPWTINDHERLAAGNNSLSTLSHLAKLGPQEAHFLFGDGTTIRQDGTIQKPDGKVVTLWDRERPDIKEKEALFWTLNADPVRRLEELQETGTVEEQAKATALLADKAKLYEFALTEKRNIYQYAMERGAPESKLRMLQDGINDTKEKLKRYAPKTEEAQLRIKKLTLEIEALLNPKKKITESDKAFIKNDAIRLRELETKISSVEKERVPGEKPIYRIIDKDGTKTEVPASAINEWRDQAKVLKDQIKAYETDGLAGPPARGLRADGSKKGSGWKGPIPTTDKPGFMSEKSIGVNLGGKEMEIPLIVPTSTKPELDLLAAGKKPTKGMIDKAVTHAIGQLKSGKSPFKEDVTAKTTMELDIDTAKRFMKEAGGDKNKAREIAKAKGYVF